MKMCDYLYSSSEDKEEIQEANLRALHVKKNDCFQRIQTIHHLALSADVPPEKEEEFLRRYNTLGEEKNIFDTLIDDIALLKLELKDDYRPDLDILDVVDGMYQKVKRIKEKMDDVEKEKAQPRTSALGPLAPPCIKLPTFNGNLKKWRNFFETFKRFVHENPDLTDVVKACYLDMCLKGNARLGIHLQGDTYQFIWKHLIDTYQNKWRLGMFYLDQMFNFRPLQKGSKSELTFLLSTYNIAYQSLKSLNIKDLADFIFFYILASKLDKTTMNEFYMSDKFLGKEVPKNSDLVEFVRDKSRILEFARGRKYKGKCNVM